MAYLVLVRHGKTSWNIEGKWTGWTDIPLGEDGAKEAREAGKTIKDIHFNIAFTSTLQRTTESLDALKKELDYKDFSVESSAALNERNYGEFTGKNKWEIKKEYGSEEFKKIRRGWDVRIPNGESLKDVYDRAVPYYKDTIFPHLLRGENILVMSHGNTMRALIKYLDNISDDDIVNLEVPTGSVYVYQFDSQGKVTSKEIRGNTVNSY